MKKMFIALFLVMATISFAQSPFIGTWTVHWYVQDSKQPEVYWPIIDFEATWTFTESTITTKDYDIFAQLAKDESVSYTYITSTSNKPIDQHLKIKDIDIDFTYTHLDSTAELFYENDKLVTKSIPANIIRIFMPKMEHSFYGSNVAYVLELTKIK